MRSSRLRWMSGMIGFAMLTPPVAAGAAVVVSSTGATSRSYPSGRMIPDGSRLVLPANASVTLLHPQGTQRLAGPGTFTVGESSEAPFLTLATGPQRRRVGAVRSGASARTQPTRTETMEKVKTEVEAGHYDVALQLVSELERDPQADRVQCHTVRNLRLYALMAAGRADQARSLGDTCMSRALAPGAESLDQQLLAGGEQLVTATP